MNTVKFECSELRQIVAAAYYCNASQNIDELIEDDVELCDKLDALSTRDKRALINKAQKIAGQYRRLFKDDIEEDLEDSTNNRENVIINIIHKFPKKWIIN